MWWGSEIGSSIFECEHAVNYWVKLLSIQNQLFHQDNAYATEFFQRIMFDVWLALLVMALHYVWAVGVANCSTRSGTPVVPALSVIYTTLMRTFDTFEGSFTTKTQPDDKIACQLSNQGSCSHFADHWWGVSTGNRRLRC